MSATMMALVRRGNQARLEERPVPALLDGRDALVRVTLSTICTSDLHILHGAVPRAGTASSWAMSSSGRSSPSGSG